VRRLLEPAATGLAASRITDDTINGLYRSLDAMRRSTTAEDLIAQDVEFHRAVVAAAGNQTLVSLLEGLFTRTARARIWRGIWDRGALDWTYAQHAVIVDALAQRDVTLATSAATVHVAASERWIKHLLEEGGMGTGTGNPTVDRLGDLRRPLDPPAPPASSQAP
jgi:GntR family transcriptional repressor for pyruvate dehydrogenase complex